MPQTRPARSAAKKTVKHASPDHARSLLHVDDLLRERLSPRSLARAGKRADSILLRMSLDELRKDRKMTQNNVARAMQMDPSEISRFEKRTEVKLGTLRQYVQALGGHLELRAVFPEKNVEIAFAGK